MNGAPGSITSQSVPKCGTATKPSPDPGWSGYTFGGWYIESSCINAYNFTSSVTSNLTLYSKWTQTVPHINFYLKVVVQNSSSYSLSNLQVKMKGKVDTDPNFTQFIDISKSSLSSGASVPSTDGPTFSLPQSTNINNMTFEFKASGSSGNLKVLVAVDSPSSLFIYNLLGSLQSFSFAPGSSTTASNGYRTMTVVISNN